MTNIIEHAYTALANTGELNLTEKDYSTNYLGRCKSYYAYLKSTGSNQVQKYCFNYGHN